MADPGTAESRPRSLRNGGNDMSVRRGSPTVATLLAAAFSLTGVAGMAACSTNSAGQTIHQSASASGSPSSSESAGQVGSPRPPGARSNRFRSHDSAPTHKHVPTNLATLSPTQKCQVRQLLAARTLEYPMSLASDRVSASTTGT